VRFAVAGRRHTRCLCLPILALCLLLPTTASAFTPQQTSQLQQLAQADQREAGYPGLILGVWQQGHGRFVSALGTSNLATMAPIGLEDRFRIGSVTKTFTATLILQLAERHKLRLSDHIDRFLHGIPGGHRVTIKHLLNQTSGFPDLDNHFSNLVLKSVHKQWNVRQLVVGSLRSQPRVCAPGKCWHYSNVNYLTLGLIAAKAGGKPVSQQLRTGVLDPLGMTGTRLRASAPVAKPAVHGYQFKPSGFARDTTRWNFSWAFTAGGLTSTLHDLHSYCPALATGRGLLSKRTQRERLDFVDISQDVDTPGAGYGLGIFSLPTAAGTFIGHNGAVPGTDALCLYSPQSKTTIVAYGSTSVELDPVSPDRLPIQMLFELVPAIAQIVASP
jgi:D-alanyl-D-alanine carboxypeptidase